jgi:seryl-tRNA synthetase
VDFILKRLSVYVESENKGGIRMNPYEQFQLNKEVEEMAKQRIEIHKKRMELSEELENNWGNEELQDRIIELEEESQELKKKIEALQANF